MNTKKIIGIVIFVVLLIAAGVAVAVTLNTTDEKSDKKAEKCTNSSLSLVVTVNQWTSIAKDLAGSCANVETIINGIDVDPHEYEPLPADVNKIANADILVVNGLGYDEWALKAAENAKEGQTIINIGEIINKEEGDNPHLWYSTDAMLAYNQAIHEAIQDKRDFFNIPLGLMDSNFELNKQNILKLKKEIDEKKVILQGASFLATESVAGYLAQDLGLKNETPLGYENAVANESEPSFADIEAFKKEFSNKSALNAKFLFYNTQETNETTADLLEAAKENNVKVIEVTEQMPDKFTDVTVWIKSILEAIQEGA